MRVLLVGAANVNLKMLGEGYIVKRAVSIEAAQAQLNSAWGRAAKVVVCEAGDVQAIDAIGKSVIAVAERLDFEGPGSVRGLMARGAAAAIERADEALLVAVIRAAV